MFLEVGFQKFKMFTIHQDIFGTVSHLLVLHLSLRSGLQNKIKIQARKNSAVVKWHQQSLILAQYWELCSPRTAQYPYNWVQRKDVFLVGVLVVKGFITECWMLLIQFSQPNLNLNRHCTCSHLPLLWSGSFIFWISFPRWTTTIQTPKHSKSYI